MARRRSCGRSACSTTSRCLVTDKIAGDMAWSDIPTCKRQGLDVDYLMLRGIFMPPRRQQGPGRLLCRAAEEGA